MKRNYSLSTVHILKLQKTFRSVGPVIFNEPRAIHLSSLGETALVTIFEQEEEVIGICYQQLAEICCLDKKSIICSVKGRIETILHDLYIRIK